MKINVVLLATLLLSACSFDKVPDEELESLQQADKFTGFMTLLGTITYGQTTAPYQAQAGKWPAYKFSGKHLDKVTIWVRSNDGDPVAWLVDKANNIVVYNDDADNLNTDSKLVATLPVDGIYYIVFRDYYKGAATFTVQLTGPASFPPPIN